MTAATAGAVRLWLHDRVCVGYLAPVRYCNGPGRVDHARTQTANARALMTATSRVELARLLHHQVCPSWLERSHGGIYIERSNAWCGIGGSTHVERIAASDVIVELAQLVGLS